MTEDNEIITQRMLTKLPQASRSGASATILEMLPVFMTSKFGREVGNAYTEFVTEEEFDELDLVIDDFKEYQWDTEDCQITSAVAEACDWNDEQKKRFWICMRDFLEIEVIQEEDECQPIKMIHPRDMNWGRLSSNTVIEARKILDFQCFDKLGANTNEALMRIFAYGLRSNVNLLPLLYDVYTRYRIKRKMRNRDSSTGAYNGAEIDIFQFCEKSQYWTAIKHQKHSPYNDIIQSISSFEARLMPRFNVNRMQLIMDDCNEFIQYSLIVGQVLNEMLQENPGLFPLQVDLVIIPLKCGATAMQMIDYPDSDSDSESESDDNNNNSNHDTDQKTNSVEFESLTDLLREAQIKVEKSTVNAKKLANSKHKVKQLLSRVLQNRSRQRVAIVIDRRFPADNELLVYQLPEEFSRIPETAYVENYIFAAANYVLPQALAHLRENIPWIGGKQDSNGENLHVFILSFECMQAAQIRLQWFWAGSGLRFEPRLFAQLWPHSFENQTIRHKFQDLAYLEKEFALQCKDPLLDEWYKALCKR